MIWTPKYHGTNFIRRRANVAGCTPGDFLEMKKNIFRFVKGGKIMFSGSRLFFFGITENARSGFLLFLIFTTRVDPTLGSTVFKLTLFEKSRGIGIRFLNLYDKSPETPWKLRSLEFMAKFRISGLRIRMKIELNTKKHFPSKSTHCQR